ncbi:transcription initiation factor TFIIF subunit beta [Enteropsectra breve]|nr:transcription initiation factor TFIIF subunit beta [Enteropsectra breve]
MSFYILGKNKPMKVNTNKLPVSVWIAKVPKYLGENIMEQQNGTKLGQLNITKSADGGNDIGLSLSDAILRAGIPKEHTIEIKDRENDMYLMSMHGGAVNADGCIDKECSIKPVLNAEYFAYKRQLKENEAGKHPAMVIDYFTEIRKGEKYGNLRELELQSRKRKSMLQNKRRERLESKDVFDMIFNAYEQRESWTVKDLSDFTGQPQAYILELLGEICVLNKKDHKNTYELKPEYKNN